MKPYKLIILFIAGFFIVFDESVCEAVSFDVNDVYFQGDSTLMGMQIEAVYAESGAFLVVTTGARYEYVPGELKLYQGLDAKNRRLLSTLTFDNEPNFIKVEDNNDHILFWSKDLNIGIYGDSTLIISPKLNQSLKCKGNFKPDYEGKYKGELLLIDDKGGMEIYPQRYEKGYEVKKIELDRIDWIADYELNIGERVMFAAFPGKPFDWEKSFKSNVVVTTGGWGPPHPYGPGVMPNDSVIASWSKFLNIIAVMYNGFYSSHKAWGPYTIINEPEYKRLLNTAHAKNMKVVAYCSLFYFFNKFHDTESFYQQIKDMHDNSSTDGVYIDGLMFDGEGYKIDDKIANWEMVRRFRQLFGADGVIVYHGTSLGSPVATVPNIDSYCDATLNGEGVLFKSVSEPYIKYQVRKYGISNTVGMWIPDTNRNKISDSQLTDALLKMNGRKWFNGYQFWQKSQPDAAYQYYLQKLASIKQTYSSKTN